MRAGIAFGSNLGDRLASVKGAREQLEQLQNFEAPLLASAVYESEPVGCEPGAPSFLNAVIEMGYHGDAAELLQDLRGIERRMGRPLEHGRNISRTLDLDLLYFGDEIFATPDLQLPHPRTHERRFVLEPLNDIRADLRLPLQTQNVGALLAALPATPRLVRVAVEW